MVSFRSLWLLALAPFAHGGPTSTATSQPTSTAEPSGTPVLDKTYDYIIVSGNAGGLPITNCLSEAGKKVLLIKKGPLSSGC
ncbi:uncharacterized protein BKA55DRAFT_698689 [Fusarium redolens]|uniref:Glucose-methanol-choline oxidoreductase N-terminal domain-containing protein n=1 Tax=Fusarium redolens TaxID=48865 RepID=A0A9P9JP03_FUSRE|nr:uncharacterized protein BKA55DRAFT_698689 [Fusarium redolens]KAH7204890.1 hypothetical protein BKA55DRAFT_698689 [Fusarium redolens]